MAKALSGDEYIQNMGLLATLSGALRSLPLDSLLETITMAQTLGPIVRPTEYMTGQRNVANSEDLVRAAITFRATINRLAPDPHAN